MRILAAPVTNARARRSVAVSMVVKEVSAPLLRSADCGCAGV